MVSTLQIIMIAFAYVCVLFLIAHITDKYKPQKLSARRKALVYSFSLAIYCTSWTFYGAVGSATSTGWGYLPIYIGPFLVYTIGWPLLKRFVQVGHEQNTTSISDFIASRFGKSQSIAVIVTIIAVIAIIPYIALQLKAITMSLEVFDAQQNLFSNHHLNALFITILLVMFSILFGTRNIDVTEHQYGMMNAIAFESIVKLVAFCSVGLFALYSIYNGPVDLFKHIINDPNLNDKWLHNLDLENFITQTILAATAIFCLPRQFHVTIVEYHQSKDLKYARVIFPLYLLLISFFVIPIVIAGSQFFAGQTISADTYILALPLAHNQGLLSVLVFIGGLSAATGMVIVATVALSTMISNHLILPIFLKKTYSNKFKDEKFTHRMLITRRIAIGLCLFLAYGFYRIIDKSQSLASIGYLSFTAVLQFMPALMLGMFWNKATKSGAIAGLASGIFCWFIITWIPSVNGYHLLSSENSYTGLSILSETLVISLLVNITAIISVSLFTRQSMNEKIQAFAYTQYREVTAPQASPINKKHKILVKDLKYLTAVIVGKQRMVTAFENYSNELKDSNTADNLLIKYTEKLISAAIGAPSARIVMLSAFKEKGINVKDVINLLDTTSKALRFNRKLTEITMDNITQGISVSDDEQHLIGWNKSYETLMKYPKGLLEIGMPIKDLILFNADRGFCGPGGTEAHIEKRLAQMESKTSYRFERQRNDGVFLEIVGTPLPMGGYVTTYTDISEYKKIEKALKENEKKTALYTDNTPVMLAYVDNNRVFQFANKAMANSLNLEKSDLIGKQIYDVLSPEEIQYKQSFFNLALKNQKQQFEYANPNDSSNYHLVTYIPNVDDLGEVSGIYIISQDISNRRKAELALKEINTTLEQRVEMRTDELHSTVKALEIAKQEAEKANISKSKFLAAASHDLLQPFNAALLFSDMLQSESQSMSQEHGELVEKTKQCLSVAKNIISSLIDVSKLDTGSIKPSIRSFYINDVLNSLEQQFSEFAREKKLSFKVCKKNVTVKSDPELLYRILQNFVSNAIRYTINGGVLITTQVRKNDAKENCLRISVWDTGIGIKEEQLNEIFNEFKQLSDPIYNTPESGLGLGLSISERISEMLKHKIVVRSNYTKGSVFHLYVELGDKQNILLKEQIPNPSSGGNLLKNTKALCVDNEPQLLDAMTVLLKKWDCQVEGVRDETDIDYLIKNNFIPDILIVDYQLDHGKTGFEFIQKIKAEMNIEIPAIIVTADHSPEVESIVQQADIKLLHKPIKPAILRAAMSNELRKYKFFL